MAHPAAANFRQQSIEPMKDVREKSNGDEASQEYYSMADLADRWRCSRATVYNRLRAEGAQVLDFAPQGKKGRKVVPASVIKEIEAKNIRRLA